MPASTISFASQNISGTPEATKGRTSFFLSTASVLSVTDTSSGATSFARRRAVTTTSLQPRKPKKTTESRYQYIPQASLTVHTGPLYQFKEVAWAPLSVQCTDNEICIKLHVWINFVPIVNQTRVSHYMYCANNDTLVYLCNEFLISLTK